MCLIAVVGQRWNLPKGISPALRYQPISRFADRSGVQMIITKANPTPGLSCRGKLFSGSSFNSSWAFQSLSVSTHLVLIFAMPSPIHARDTPVPPIISHYTAQNTP
jgi:hypothetical protein